MKPVDRIKNGGGANGEKGLAKALIRIPKGKDMVLEGPRGIRIPSVGLVKRTNLIDRSSRVENRALVTIGFAGQESIARRYVEQGSSAEYQRSVDQREGARQ